MTTMGSTDSKIDAAILERYSARAFLAREVPRPMIEAILDVARRAASGSNTQPWQVYVLQGRARDDLIRKVCAAHDEARDRPEASELHREEYPYYPEKWTSPFLDRRRQNGWGLYTLLGIAKGDRDAMHVQHQRNFRFFDAPVGLMFTIDRAMAIGSFIDYGMFIQNIMLAALARGLATCPQAAWNPYWRIVLPHIGAGECEMLVCGMSLGWPDQAALVNTFRTPREEVSTFTHWLG